METTVSFTLYLSEYMCTACQYKSFNFLQRRLSGYFIKVFLRSSLNQSQCTYYHWNCHYFSTFSHIFRGLYIWKACQILSAKYFYQWVQWHQTWWMFVLWSLWSLCLVNLHVFFYPCEQESAIVPLHFFLLLLVLMCVLTIFLSWVSHNAYMLSNVYTCYGYSYISL